MPRPDDYGDVMYDRAKDDAALRALDLPEFRVTRPALYPVGSPGHTSPSAREGHYVRAEGYLDADIAIRKRLNIPDNEPLAVELWKEAGR